MLYYISLGFQSFLGEFDPGPAQRFRPFGSVLRYTLYSPILSCLVILYKDQEQEN